MFRARFRLAAAALATGRARSRLGEAALATAPAVAALAALGASWAAWSATPAAPAVTTGRVSKADVGTRLRVFAEAGDYKITSPELVAVVRKRDGWLVDLWRRRAFLPTVEQLGTTANIDAIWQMYPSLRIGKTDYPATASRVSALRDSIEVEAFVEALGAKYRALTRYTLATDAPKLVARTRWSVVGGGSSGALEFGDELKWGNVTYFVEGVATPRMKYEGSAAWIGRHGAGGDLLLRSRSGPKLWVDYGAKFRGFQGNITALYRKASIPAQGEVEVERELSFEALPLPSAKPEASGLLRAKIVDEADRPLPSKMRVDRLGHPNPVFGDDGGLSGADRFAWTGNGEMDLVLPAGRYVLLFTAGYERDAVQKTVNVPKNGMAGVKVALPRVVSTPGWIAADLHLHQAPSVDADIGLAERVVSIAAEGVELAVATDHYVVTDLSPTVQWLTKRGLLTRALSTISGSEVSTLGHRYGHFNVFPLSADRNVAYWNTTPSALFADARRQSPKGVIQVNHPRWDPAIGYFSYFGKSKESADFVRPGYDPNYDTLEVYNGDDARDLKKVRVVLEDWMHLLSAGRRYTATGSSDSHKLAFLDPGLPRTYIHYGDAGDDEQDAKASPAAVIAALKAGRAYVTSGPLLDVSVDGKGPGETVVTGGRAQVKVKVQAPKWVDVRSVEVLVNGRSAAYHIVPRGKSVLRLDKTFAFPVKEKGYVIVVAQGERGLPNASREATQPFAFSNPIWLEP
ncbi:MAG: CehA/McbA family metallohydrolase [Polyangiaceae bacterium]